MHQKENFHCKIQLKNSISCQLSLSIRPVNIRKSLDSENLLGGRIIFWSSEPDC